MIEKLAERIYDQTSEKIRKSSLLDYKMVTGKAQIIVLDEFNNDFDGRLKQKEYLQNSFTIVTFLKQSQEIVGKATFFVVEHSVWKNIVFWKLDDTILKKDKLDDYIEDKNKKCVIMGYGQISNRIRNTDSVAIKSKSIEVYYKVLKSLIQTEECAVYCEPCGYFCLSDEVVSKEQLDVSMLDKTKMGCVCPESVVSEKISVLFHMKKLESCYHCSTLGPIYLLK